MRIKYNYEIDCKINIYDDKFYFKAGTSIFHRLDGPAIEYSDGEKVWYQNDKLHRTDGPAREDRFKYKEYWLNGEQINFSGTDEEWIIKNLLE